MDIEEIKKIIPHRYPFLMVDRILEITDQKAVGLKNVSISEPFFQGHFPDRPVMPGVLIIEALAQVGGVLMLKKNENAGKIAYFASITSARFRRVVTPGDQLILEAEIIKLKSRVGLIKGVARVGDEVACEAEMMFSMADR
jgi:3-hydroxyacyl-[acyl-carrier-protein] dehydratase